MLNLLDGWFKLNPGEGAFYSIFGFIFVFFGIVVLILIFTLLGFLMKKINERGKKQKQGKAESALPSEEKKSAPEEGISPEVIAAIAAAVAAYCEESGGKCDFVVKRIKKI